MRTFPYETKTPPILGNPSAGSSYYARLMAEVRRLNEGDIVLGQFYVRISQPLGCWGDECESYEEWFVAEVNSAGVNTPAQLMLCLLPKTLDWTGSQA
jgi:hypothetical protein